MNSWHSWWNRDNCPICAARGAANPCVEIYEEASKSYSEDSYDRGYELGFEGQAIAPELFPSEDFLTGYKDGMGDRELYELHPPFSLNENLTLLEWYNNLPEWERSLYEWSFDEEE